MKNVLLGLAMIVSVTAIGQDIKIKKDKISIDGTEVAVLDKQKLVYNVLTLDNKPVFSIERKATPLLDGSLVYWSLLTDLSNNKTNEVIDYGKEQGLSFQKAIVASVCNEKYKFISAAGLDEKGVLEFINGTPTNITKVFDDANQKTADQLKAEYEAMTALKITVENGHILQKQEVYKDGQPVMDYVVIGEVTKSNVTFMPNFPPSLVYTVNSLYSEKDNNSRIQNRVRTLGAWYATKTGYTNPNTKKNIKDEIITSDNKYYNLRGTLTDTEKINLSFYGEDKDFLSKQIVAKLLFNGYKFDAMKVY